jgi:LacI family transcriptional regulator
MLKEERMGRRATIADVARSAGVSVATVDRVLNGRHPVREETARRVYEAATAVGFHATGLIRRRLAEEELPRVRLGFVLQKPRQAFYQELERGLREAVAGAAGVRASVEVDFLQGVAPAHIVERLEAMGGRAQAVAMVAPDHPMVSAAVERLRARGVPVFALLSDFAAGVRAGYVGVNNRKVGRTAAWMLARAAGGSGKVAVFVGSHRFDGHDSREIGFRAYFRENAPEFEVLETMVNLDTRQITHEATLSLLRRHPDLVGLFVAGGGMEGAIAALREEGRRLAAVVPEITAESRAALAEGLITMAIATPLPTLCREIVARMVGRIGEDGAEAPGQTFLPFDIYLPENI